MTSYDGLTQKLKEKGITKTSLTEKLGISSRTIAKISRGEKIADHVLKKIASFLDCEPGDLYRYVSDNPILEILKEEKNMRLHNGLYHEVQIRMTYNSNHIEGSKLSEEETRFIFETNTLDFQGPISIDDIVETVNHFRAIDYAIDMAQQPLSEEIIKELHRILKTGTSDSTLSWFAVGDYKKRSNVVGGKETAKPQEVSREMKKLISNYESLKEVAFEDIVAFHHDFECIHPFQDGNGRVGRLIAFKECLRHNYIPFIIEDSKKMFYYRGLSEWDNERGYLLDTCRDGQDFFKKLLSLFEISIDEKK